MSYCSRLSQCVSLTFCTDSLFDALGTLGATNRSKVRTRPGNASAVLSDRANAVCPGHGNAVLSYRANTVFPGHDDTVLSGRANAVFLDHANAVLSDRANAYVYVNVYTDRKPLLANMTQQASYI